MMLEPAPLAQVARNATRIGSDLLRDTRPVDIREKSDRNLVTELDVRIEREIRDYLNQATPDIPFFGEEEGPGSLGAGGKYTWMLDPIDGTSNFIHGVPLCAVSLALISGTNAIVAAIDLPFLDRQYSAAEGLGAFVNGKRTHVSRADDLSRSLISIGDYAVGDNAARKNRRRLELTVLLAERVERIRMLGSAAIDLVWVAEGRLDGSVMLANHPWDAAPGVLIAREAGAVVVDDLGKPHSTTSTETIAASPYIADELVDIVRMSRQATER